MNIELYQDSLKRLPSCGKIILAEQTEKSITVYQAFKPSIAHHAIEHQEFGGPFQYSRMSWIKPSFLWMMYRSGWASKEGQENILAITIAKSNFEKILKNAVHSTYNENLYKNNQAWKQQLEQSEVRLQWDPDHDPYGNKLERRAIQLGLKGATLKNYGSIWIENIKDITDFVIEQRTHVNRKNLHNLYIPYETVYNSTLDNL